MTALIRYEAARQALAECKAIDEVKALADKAAAMQAYSRMAKDKSLELDAAEIRIRAERRLGEMLAAQKASEGLNRGAAGAGINQHTPDEVRSLPTTAPKLADAGISKDLSSRAQKLAAVPEDEFEQALAEKREVQQREGERVTSRLLKRGEEALAQQAPKVPEEPTDYEVSEEEIAEAQAYQAEVMALFTRAMESDDPLGVALKENAQLRAENESLRSRLFGLMNEKNEAVRLATGLRKALEKLERNAA